MKRVIAITILALGLTGCRYWEESKFEVSCEETFGSYNIQVFNLDSVGKFCRCISIQTPTSTLEKINDLPDHRKYNVIERLSRNPKYRRCYNHLDKD